MVFFNATVVPGGPDGKQVEIVLNPSAIIGIWNNRVVLSRETLDVISMQIFASANKISHILVNPEVTQSLLDKG